MDTKKLEQVICRALQSMQDETHFILLVMCGDNCYSLERFFVEADEIGRKNRLKIAVDASAAVRVPEERLKSLHGVESVLSGECPETYDELFRGVDAAVFGSMDIGTASKIGNLTTDTLAARIASEAFMRGIRMICNAFPEELEIRNQHYRAAVGELAKRLNSFGMEFMPLDRIKKQFENVPAAQVEVPVKIITEDIVKKLDSHELRVAQDTVLTPLAKDVLREKKIVLTRGK